MGVDNPKTQNIVPSAARGVSKTLLIGCGSKHQKLLAPGGNTEWGDLTTLDINPDHKPDVIHDLNVTPYPFPSDAFDEVHAYEVLEHLGRQGDYKAFFEQFSELWRILKPNGFLCASVPLPTSVWAWADPSHTRIIPRETLAFLDQAQYAAQIGVTAMSDFRSIYKADFEPDFMEDNNGSLFFVLKAIKPSRLTNGTSPR